MRLTSSGAQQALATLGTRLRELRHDAGLTGRDLARLADWHSSKVSKIEHGKQLPMIDDIMLWCMHCNAENQTADLIASLRAVQGLFIEWRRIERSGLLHAQQRFLPLWQRTKRFRAYSSWLVPGIVQTRAYTYAVLSSIQARLELPNDVDTATQARIERQEILRLPERQLAIVVEESVLRNNVGGPDIMAAQLGHLLTVSSLPSISFGVIPQTANRAQAWPVEAFWIFDDEQVSVELVSGHLTITQPHEIAQYAKVFGMLADLAVYGAPARTLIAAAIAATADG